MSESRTASPPTSSRADRVRIAQQPDSTSVIDDEPQSGERADADPGAGLVHTAELLVHQLSNLHSGPSVFHLVVRLGEAAIPPLERLVQGPSQAIYHSRCLAIDALAAIGTPHAVQALTRTLRDSVARELAPVPLEAEGVVVNRIAEHLSRYKTHEVTDALLAALRSRPYAYCAAALGLTADPRAIPLLVECLFEDSARPAAAAALRRFGKTALPWLTTASLERKSIGATEPPTRVLGRAAATKLLGECAGSAIGNAEVLRVLREALDDPEGSVRLEAALALVRHDAERAGGVLASALDDSDTRRAQITAKALAQLPTAGRLIVDIIAARVRSAADRRRRLRAVGLAGRLGLPAAVPRLRDLATAADPQLRLAAICALGQIPTANAEAIARFLTDHEPVIRWRALQALRRQHALTAESATPFLGDEDPEVRRLADASVREDLGTAGPALYRAAFHFGAPLQGLSPRLRLWWHAWRLLGTSFPASRRESR
jgi:HEAT repeat protein